MVVNFLNMLNHLFYSMKLGFKIGYSILIDKQDFPTPTLDTNSSITAFEPVSRRFVRNGINHLSSFFFFKLIMNDEYQKTENGSRYNEQCVEKAAYRE